MTDSRSHVSDISFDRAYAQQLSAAEQRLVSDHVASCPRCRQRQSYLEQERAAFLAAAPSWGDYTAQHGRAAPAPPRKLPRFWMPLTTATALAAAALLMSTRLMAPSAISTRTKGGAQLGFYVKHGSQVVRGRPDHVVHPGDVLRFTYSSPAATYFALLGRDARHASLFYPDAKQAIALAKGAEVPLDFGVEIDAVPGDEHMYALFCSEAVALPPLLAALDKADTLAPPGGCSVRELQLRKAIP
jgi:hypothetical protein